MADLPPKKRLLDETEEFDEVSNIRESKSARVHGLLTHLSPVKTNASGTTKYFEGEISDGKKNVRLVGFDTKVHQKLQGFHENQEAVMVGNCQIKESKYTSQLELVVRNNSELQKSPVKFDVDMTQCGVRSKNCEITIGELSKLTNFQRVSVCVKVVCVKECEVVKRGLVKQECTIADASGSCMITLWEDNTDILEENSSYRLSGLMVRTFRNKKYLSIPKDDFQIEVISDIGDVEDNVEESNEREMDGAVVVGVKSFDIYNACYSCKGKVEAMTDDVGECGRCGITQKLDKCKEIASAKIDLEAGGIIKNVSVFLPIIEELCQAEPSKIALLSCEAFNVVYSEKNVILSVSQ